MEIKLDKYINKNIIGILNVTIVSLAILIYEILYCNSLWIQQIDVYNFSIYRLIIYCVILGVIIKDNKNKAEVIECLKNKKREKITAITLLIGLVVFCAFIFVNIIIEYMQALPVILLTILGIQYFILNITKDYAKNIVVTILCFGFICAIGSPFNNIIDEKRHFLSAYNISMGNLNYNEPIIHEELQFMEKTILVSDFSKYFGVKYENEFINDYIEGDVTNTPATYSQIIYIPSAIGIFIAKVLGSSIADIYISGRITNCIAYAVLMYIALKLIPFKRRLLYVIACMPTLICLSASYSVDAISMGIISIFIAYCFKLCNENEIKRNQIIKLMIIFLGVLQLKSMGYIVVGVVALILPVKNILKQHWKTVLIGIIIILIIQPLLFMATKQFTGELKGDSRVKGTDAMMQIEYVKENPLEFTKVLLTTLVNYFTRYSALYRMHERVFFTNSNVYTVFLFMMMYILCVSITDNSTNFNKKEKIIFLITFALQNLIILAVLYITYTPVGADKIEGFHPRYAFPVLLLLLGCFSNKNLKLEDKEELIETNTSITMGTFMIISILGMITLI